MPESAHEINAETLKRAYSCGALCLGRHREAINLLNVFPVPDGDTGSNMFLTASSAADSLSELAGAGVCEVSERAAKGAFLGARGCSGVILSQYLAGFAEALKGLERASAENLAVALLCASRKARRTLSNPKEGTILSVADAVAEGALSVRGDDIAKVLVAALARGEEALQKTPEQLPVLAQAGVVDAGGKGLLVFLDGVRRGLLGEWSEELPAEELAVARPRDERLRHRFCVSMLLQGTDVAPYSVEAELSARGCSEVIVVQGDGLLKLHAHTDRPDLVLEYASSLGAPSDINIDDMEEQRQTTFSLLPDQVVAGVSLAAVVPGDGVASMLRSLGAMTLCAQNPSTGEVARLLDTAEVSDVILVTASRDAVPVAERAAMVRRGKTLIVPSVTIPEAVAAVVAFQPGVSAEANLEQMKFAASKVRTAIVARARRASGGVAVGEIVSIVEGQMRRQPNWSVAIIEAVRDLLASSSRSRAELVTIYRGAGASPEDSSRARAELAREFPSLELTEYYGGQPGSEFVIGLE